LKILIVGNGGREHAIARKIYDSDSFLCGQSHIFTTKGSPGLDKFSTPVDISPGDVIAIADFAATEGIDFTVVGPEIPLSLGIVDEFHKRGFKIFGPTQAAAQIESSKIFSKDLMQSNGIPTAKYKSFSVNNINTAYSYLKSCVYPVVLKADGLAAGKGVIIAENESQAVRTVKEFTEYKMFGNAGESFVIEEYLTGFEVSVFAVTDGNNFVVLPYSQDHKKIGENDTGKNTGGMGAYAPANPLVTDKTKEMIIAGIIKPTLNALTGKGIRYSGCLYLGLMICAGADGGQEPYLIEYNCRFGDPETQAVLPIIKSDFLELLLASAEGTIGNYKAVFRDAHCCCVVLASGGYPDNFGVNKVISGIEEAEKNCLVFHSGTGYSTDKSEIVTTGGRVLSVTGESNVSMTDAVKSAYKSVAEIKFDCMYYRNDIGAKFSELISGKNN
jgi:phosphoribosylamine--glycine ligase